MEISTAKKCTHGSDVSTCYWCIKAAQGRKRYAVNPEKDKARAAAYRAKKRAEAAVR